MKWGWILALVCLSGCGSGGFSAKKGANKGQVFRTSINVNPTTLDPVTLQDVETLPIIQSVYEGLVSWDENNKLKPQLAEKWDFLPDGRTYIFHLRKGVKFHNGREMTAEDVKFSLERACDPALNSPTAANYLGDIVGVNEKLARKAGSISGIKVVDAGTIRIEIDKPRTYFLGKLTYPCAFIVSKEATTPGKEIASVKAMVGTGPFKAESFVPQQLLTLVANDNYYEGRPKLDRIEQYVIKDSQTRLAKFRSGEMDSVGIPRQDILGLQRDPALGSQVKLYPRPAVAYAAMNSMAYAPFKDRRVRRAIAMAVDVKKIVNELLGGVNPLAERILPPGIAEGDVKGLPYDPAAAAKELAAAGYPGGKGLPPLELVIRDQTPDTRIVAESMAAQIGANLGITVATPTREWRSLLEARNHNKLGFFVLSWYGDYPDPQNFLSNLLTTKGPGNHFGYSNKEVDRLCDSADSEPDAAKRMAEYLQAEKLILDDAVWIPLFFVRDGELLSPKVQGLRDNLLGHMPDTQVTLK